jgi:hypothetical protein
MEWQTGLDQQTQHQQEERPESFRWFLLPLVAVAIAAAALELPRQRVLVLHLLDCTMLHSSHLDPTEAMTEACALDHKIRPVDPHEIHHHHPDRDHDDQMVESVYAGPSVACFQSEREGLDLLGYYLRKGATIDAAPCQS